MIDQISERHSFIQSIVEGVSGEHPLIGVAPGSGQITRTACHAGADVLFALSAGVYRAAGVGSLASFLAYGNANEQAEELLTRHVLPHCGTTPVVVGQMPGDPVRSLDERLGVLRTLGINAITNWPASGLADGVMRQIMAQEGMGHHTEREMLTAAKEQGFAVFGFALTGEEVESFCEMEVDGLILNVGLTRAAPDGLEKKNQIRRAIAAAREMWRAIERQKRQPVCFLFGGSIIQPLDLEEILREIPIHGYAGGSAFERIPVEAIVDSTVRRLKGVPRPVSRTTQAEEHPGRPNMVGSSREMMEMYNLVDRIAPHDVNVLIEGETGTGKELVAYYLHKESPRRDMPFVTMNCGAVPDSLIESEFFGHEKGAFTGANERRRGKFELANHGVLFLDEIGDLSSRGQASLLRVIQQGEIFRVGGQAPIRVDVRILTATNKSLEREVADGTFRSDLYYRITAVVIRTPSLRERPSDIPTLVRYVLSVLSMRLHRRLIGVTDAFMQRLQNHSWPGNVRELEHVLTRAALLEDSAILEGYSVHLESDNHVAALAGNGVILTRKQQAEAALKRCEGNKTRAAAELRISRKTLYEWLRR